MLAIKAVLPTNVISDINERAEKISPEDGLVRGADEAVKDIRSCQTRYIHFMLHKSLYMNIMNSIYPYVEYHQDVFDVSLYKKLEIQHVTYNIGDHYITHQDIEIANHTASSRRKISMVLMLSDRSEYEGGNLVIENKAVPLGLGDLVMFSPAQFHRVDKVTSGVRKCLVMWALGPHWK
jgi:predicted 2-oxoglutarate/Fe(II)-dependent dioxygenase YbiX